MDNRTIREEIERVLGDNIVFWEAPTPRLDGFSEAVEALLPLITAAREEGWREGIEAAAKVAEGRATDDPTWLNCPVAGPYHAKSMCARHRREVAAAIRSLPPSQ